MKKPVTGLTGGISSGKTTVGKFFVEFGVTVIDADQLAREVVVPGSAGLRDVVDAFGQEFLAEDGTLDRSRLGLRVFGDPVERKRLDSLLHPRIRALYEERCAAAQDSPTPYIIYDAALLVELERYKDLAKLIVVAAAPELQMARVMKRYRLTETAARDRLGAQAPLERKLAVADFVITNDNDREALRARTKGVHEQLLRMFR